jgi:hypothetical protein
LVGARFSRGMFAYFDVTLEMTRSAWSTNDAGGAPGGTGLPVKQLPCRSLWHKFSVGITPAYFRSCQLAGLRALRGCCIKLNVKLGRSDFMSGRKRARGQWLPMCTADTARPRLVA